MEADPQSRTGSAVPRPGAATEFSEEEKRALELNDEVEHSDGVQREKQAQQADDLAGSGNS